MTKSFILLMAGSSTRYNSEKNKVFEIINDTPIFMYSLLKAYDISFDEYILVIKEDDLDYVKGFISKEPFNNKVKYAFGKSERYLSVKEGLKLVTSDAVCIHDAARPLVVKEDIIACINELQNYKVTFLSNKATNTLRKVEDIGYSTVDRDSFIEVTTPQCFTKDLFDVILNNNNSVTDEVSLFDHTDFVKNIISNNQNPKITYQSDLDFIRFTLSDMYIGHSLDYHPFSNEGILVLGGTKIEGYNKLIAHSDGDVVLHSITEAILGASCLGDLGTLYPDNSDKYKDVDSSKLLIDTINRIENLGYHVHNIDIMVYLIKPRLSDIRLLMEENIKRLTKCNHVCVKAATLNKRGLISLEEGIGSEATVLLSKRLVK